MANDVGGSVTEAKDEKKYIATSVKLHCRIWDRTHKVVLIMFAQNDHRQYSAMANAKEKCTLAWEKGEKTPLEREMLPPGKQSCNDNEESVFNPTNDYVLSGLFEYFL